MSEENKEPYVQVAHSEGIATIEFYHPQSNSLPGILLKQLTDAITTEGNNPTTRVIILRSAGTKVFCSGASFDEYSSQLLLLSLVWSYPSSWVNWRAMG